MAKTKQAVDFDFSMGAQKKGTKVSESNIPELSLDSSYGKFSLNSKSLELMGGKVGSHVLMYDQLGQGADSQETRFYISLIDYKVGDKNLGAIIGKNKSFNFSGVYNSILANDMEQKDTIQRELMKLGKLVATDYGKSVKYISTKKGIMTLTELGEKTLDLNDRWGIDDTVDVTIFALGLPIFLDHKPQAQNPIYTTLEDLYAARGEEVVEDAIDDNLGKDEEVED